MALGDHDRVTKPVIELKEINLKLDLLVNLLGEQADQDGVDFDWQGKLQRIRDYADEMREEEADKVKDLERRAGMRPDL